MSTSAANTAQSRTYRTRDGRPVTARFVDENGTVIDDSDVEILRIGAETV